MGSKKINSFSELNNFPFNSLKELSNQFYSGNIKLTVNRSVARTWAMNSSESTFFLKLSTYFFTFSPYIISILLAVFFILNQNWLWLITVPIFFLEVDVLNFGSFVRYGNFKTIFKLLIGLSFILSIIIWNLELFILSILLIIQWVFIILVYTNAEYFILKASVQNEHLFVKLWNGNALQLITSNGTRYSRDYRESNGEKLWYEDIQK